MSHNEKLTALLNSISVGLREATSQNDLITAVSLALRFEGKIQYENSVAWTVVVFSLAIMVIAGYFGFSSGNGVNPWALAAMFISGSAGVVAVGYVVNRNGEIKELSDKIFRTNILFDNNLSEVEINGEELAQSLGNHFKEFDRGNHLREIVSIVKGVHNCEKHTFEYQIFHFHYVVRRTETRIVSNGKGGTRTETRTVYDHYNRHGLIMNFCLYTSLAVLEHGARISGEPFRPASNEFNRHFKAMAKTEIDAAKFLKPAVVVLFEDLRSNFSEINFEINSDGLLCLSFDDEDVIYCPRRYGIEDPANFIKEIEGLTEAKKLKALLSFITCVMRLSDNNFRGSNDAN